MDARQSRGDRRKARPGATAAVAAVLLSVLSVLPVAAQAAERATHVALVIGNSAYEYVPFLPNPGNDAKAVGDAFKSLDYEVTWLMDADYHALHDGVRRFKQAARGKEVAVVFYAGHGIGVGGENYLVPVDAELGYADTVEDETISLKRLMSAVGNTRHLGLVILDACRNNPFVTSMKGSTRSIDRGLARLEETPGKTMVAYAARHGEVASDGDGAHSPYTEALLKYLKEEPGLEVRKLFGKVHDAVVDTTRKRLGEERKQEPWTYQALGGRDFYLASAAAPIPTPKGTGTSGGGTATTPPSGAAARAYEATERAGTVAAYLAFIKEFPYSFEAKLARAQIAKLEGAKEPLVVAGGDPLDEEPPEIAAPSPEELQERLQLSLEQKRLVQMGLAAAGYDPGGVDGMLGGKTRRALQAWQAWQEVEATGYLTREQGEVLAALGREESGRRRAEAERERKAQEAEEAERRAQAERERKEREEEERRRAEAERKLKALKPRCPVESGQCWIELANMPSCHALVWWRETEEPAAYKWWKGGCTDGLASGEGVVSYRGADGKDYRFGEGSYVDGKPHGRWTDYLYSGTGEGRYVDGKRHGQWTVHRRKWTYEGPYVDGKRHGQWTEYRDGIYRDIEREGPYVDGKKHGVWTRKATHRDDDYSSCREDKYIRGKRVKKSDSWSC